MMVLKLRCVNKDLTTEVAYTGITIDDVEDGETNASVVSNVDTIGVANLPPYIGTLLHHKNSINNFL